MPRPVGKKWSQFSPATTTEGSATLNFEQEGQNRTITVDNFLAQYPNLGEPVVGGDGVPVLEVAGATYTIRSLESTGGLSISVGPTNNILLGSSIENGSEGGAEVFVDDTATPLIARTFQGSGGISVTQSGEVVTVQGTIEPQPTKRVLVNTLSDFPPPVLNVITLADDTVYYLGDFIDIGVNSFVVGDNSVITSDSSFVAGLFGTASVPVFDDQVGVTFSMTNIRLDFPFADIIRIDSPTVKTGFFSVSRVQITECQTIAILNNVRIIIIEFLGVEKSQSGFIISGENSVINVDSALIEDFSGSMLDLTNSVNDVVSIENATVVSNNPANIIIDGLPDSGNVIVGGVGVFRAVNVIGPFTSTGNITPKDLRWNFADSNALPDSQNIGSVYMPINATETTINNGVPVLVQGVWTPGTESRYSADANGRLTYIGAKPIFSQAAATFSIDKQAGGTDKYQFYLYKNGAPIDGAVIGTATESAIEQAMAVATSIDMVTGDYLELWAEGIGTNDNVIVFAANIIASGA